MASILVVEDEDSIGRGLKFNFEAEGYRVTLAVTGQAAVRAFEQADPPFDLVVLDLMLPGMSGYDVCRTIRGRDERVPIIILTARTLSDDKIEAFDAGTDQYVTKPFSLKEMLSRVRNLLARRTPARPPVERPAADRDEWPPARQFGGVTVDLGKFQIITDRDGHTTRHELTTLEAQLLRYFLEREGKVLARQDILEAVWPPDAEVTQRTIDNFVMRLRRMIEPDPSNPRHLLSVRGTGYRFVSTPES